MFLAHEKPKNWWAPASCKSRRCPLQDGPVAAMFPGFARMDVPMISWKKKMFFCAKQNNHQA